MKIKAIETIITPNCQRVNGVEGAIDEALRRIKQKAIECISAFPEGTYSIELSRVKDD